MDSAMNEEVNYCNQCGAKISSDSKFCSSCGCALQNSSTKTSLDKTIKVEVTNTTVEKGFKAVEKGVKATGKGLSFVSSSVENVSSLVSFVLRKVIKAIAMGAILYGVAFIGFMLQKSLLKQDRDRALQDLRSKIEAARSKPIVQSEWEVLATDDPASGKKIGTATTVSSNGGLCSMSVEHRIGGQKLTSFHCNFEHRHWPIFPPDISIKFDNNPNVYTMKKRVFKENDSFFVASSFYVIPDADNKFRYDRFVKSLVSGKTVAIELTPTVDHDYYDFYNYATGAGASGDDFERLVLDPVWIKFSLKGAKEAIAKLGKEL